MADLLESARRNGQVGVAILPDPECTDYLAALREDLKPDDPSWSNIGGTITPLNDREQPLPENSNRGHCAGRKILKQERHQIPPAYSHL